MLIDLGSTHNLIHCKLAKVLNCIIYLTPEFEVMIVDGGTINLLGKFYNITLTLREFVLNIQIIVIPMGGIDVVLGVHWLQSLGIMLLIFKNFS